MTAIYCQQLYSFIKIAKTQKQMNGMLFFSRLLFCNIQRGEERLREVGKGIVFDVGVCAYEYKLVLLCMDMDVKGFYFTYLIVL